MMTEEKWGPSINRSKPDCLYRNRDLLMTKVPETAEVCAREDRGGVSALRLFFQANHAQVGDLDRHRILRVPLLACAAALHASDDDGFHAMEQYSGRM